MLTFTAFALDANAMYMPLYNVIVLILLPHACCPPARFLSVVAYNSILVAMFRKIKAVFKNIVDSHTTCINKTLS